jgi:hypothetical protein
MRENGVRVHSMIFDIIRILFWCPSRIQKVLMIVKCVDDSVDFSESLTIRIATFDWLRHVQLVAQCFVERV